MESLLGLTEEVAPSTEVVDSTTQQSFKMVPWISWDEWSFVNDSLFSSSSSSISAALQRVATWRSRGCIPVAVDVTASIIEIRQQDPFFRNDIDRNAEQSEEMLAMLYSMAIMRLVNGVVEKTRKKNEISIAAAADDIDLPRMLIDVRHEGSHRDLPSLPLVRLASSKALDWLKSYYWKPQKSAFSVGSDVTTNLRKEIKQKLLDLASCLNVNRSTQSSSPSVERKRSKKDITKAVKNVLRLYSSDSAEVATIVMELLLKVSEFSGLTEVGDISEFVGNDVRTGYDWNTIILKLSHKEPELLPTLLRATLNKYETLKNGEYLSPQNVAQSRQIDRLPRLFEWLLNILKHVQRKMSGDKPESPFNLPNSTLFEFLRTCVVASSHGDNQLMSSALTLLKMMGNSTLTRKLRKLSSLSANTAADTEVLSPNADSMSFFSTQEDSIHQATKNFELIKSRCLRKHNVELREHPVGLKRRWKVADSWKQCPIGMLPHTIGFSGRLPVLDLNDDDKEETEATSNGDEQGERDQSRQKREPELDVASIDDATVKKLRETTWNCEPDIEENSTSEGLTGHLIIDGVWKKVSQDEVNAIASAVEIWGLPLNLPSCSSTTLLTEGKSHSARVG